MSDIKNDRIVSIMVVFIDIEKYSLRNNLYQAAVIDNFTQLLKSTIDNVDRNVLPIKGSCFFIPTGDGTAIVFKSIDRPDLHLELAKDLLQNIYNHNNNNQCNYFEDNGYCNCHDNFNVRIGLSGGKGVFYSDIKGAINIASTELNMASRIMNLVDKNQIALTEHEYESISGFFADPSMATAFVPLTTIIKHGSFLKYRVYKGSEQEPYINDRIYRVSDFNSREHSTKNRDAENKPAKKSLFEFRRDHYREEKELICKLALQNVLMNQDITTKDKIYFLIDSGSTTHPLFKILCDHYHRFEDVFKKVEIVTNNIEGISVMSVNGRKDSDPTSDMLYRCNVLSGAVEGKYSAILSEESISSLSEYISKIDKNNSAVVTFITGNYISVKDGVLWRGEYHGSMKNAYIYNSDYVYILTPLGKIFDMTCDQINSVIATKADSLSLAKSYKTLIDGIIYKGTKSIENLIPVDYKKPIKIITTERKQLPQHYQDIYPSIIFEYFNRIQVTMEILFKTALVRSEFQPIIDSQEVKEQLANFGPNYIYEAIYNYEFPHKEIRNYMKTVLK